MVDPALVAQIVAQLQGPGLAPTLESDMRVSECCRYYMENRGSYVKSADRYRQCFAHLVRHLGRRGSSKIRQNDVDKYARDRAAEGAAPKTAWNELAALRTALNYAWMCDKSPRPKFKLVKPKGRRKRVAWPDECKRLLEAADLPLRRLIWAAWTTGCRRGELIGAQRADLDGSSLSIRDTKTGEPKTVEVGAALLGMLREEPVCSEYVFVRWRYDNQGRRNAVVPWYRTTVRRAWTDCCERAGVKGLTFHDLRRSMASVSQDRGHGQTVVRTQGGWSDPTALNSHYSWASREAQRGLVADLEAALLVPDPSAST